MAAKEVQVALTSQEAQMMFDVLQVLQERV